jgi:nitroimidazol reductase NimA-like FMN-containing flavoprotein (pyridoxamine 5'-phosphate oxidase superfamily)
VLATQGDAQPYGSVIALAVSADLTQAAFCTSRATRKYSLLERCDRVALVIDDRSKHGDDIRCVSAVTATGRAAELAPGADHDHWQAELLARHPYLEEFLASPSCAVFLVEIVRYLHVVRFQEVSQWIPRASG